MLKQSTAYREESFHEVIEELKPLLHQHWLALARNKDVIPFNPNYEAYGRLQDTGFLSMTIARRDERIVGYAIYFLYPHLHYQDHVWAVSDIFWLDPSYRNGMTGPRLFKEAERNLRARGASVMHTTTKNAHPAAGRVLSALGHASIETGYSKMLRGN